MIIQVMSKSDASIKCYTLQTNKPNKQHNNNKYIILDMKIIIFSLNFASNIANYYYMLHTKTP